METPTMGRVLVTALIENLSDLYLADKGIIPRNQIRRVEVHDALVDTGATGLSMPRRLIDQLGLEASSTRRVRTSAGPRTAQIYGGVRLTIMVPLEVLDFVVDPGAQRLIGNPAHGGEQIIEIY
jgi:hypothetical protein